MNQQNKTSTCVHCGKAISKHSFATFKRWNGYYHDQCIKEAAEKGELHTEPNKICPHCDNVIEYPHQGFGYESPKTKKQYILHSSCLQERMNLDHGYDRCGKKLPKYQLWKNVKVL